MFLLEIDRASCFAFAVFLNQAFQHLDLGLAGRMERLAGGLCAVEETTENAAHG